MLRLGPQRLEQSRNPNFSDCHEGNGVLAHHEGEQEHAELRLAAKEGPGTLSSKNSECKSPEDGRMFGPCGKRVEAAVARD